MSLKQKWYENKTLLFLLIIFIFPVGIIGIWLRNTETPKKVVYTILGFFAWMFTFPIVLFFLLLIFTSISESENNYQNANLAYDRGEYLQAVSLYDQVDSDYEFYSEAVKKRQQAQEKYDKQQAGIKAYKEQAIKEVDSNLAPVINNRKPYSVLLYDAKIEENIDDTLFSHQYKVVLEDSIGTPYDTVTNWITVSDTAFDYYINDVGMTIRSANNTSITNYSSPPGYNNYVGNTKYGRWETDNNGSSFWQFYGQYAFMRTMFGFNQPIYRYDYNDYNTYYRGTSSYYGTNSGNGRYTYGTQSSHATSLKPQSSFKQSVQNRINRSSSRNFSSLSSYRSNANNSLARSSSSRSISRSSSRSGSFRSGSVSRGGK